MSRWPVLTVCSIALLAGCTPAVEGGLANAPRLGGTGLADEGVHDALLPGLAMFPFDRALRGEAGGVGDFGPRRVLMRFALSATEWPRRLLRERSRSVPRPAP
jgi:hypothetical protein